MVYVVLVSLAWYTSKLVSVKSVESLLKFLIFWGKTNLLENILSSYLSCLIVRIFSPKVWFDWLSWLFLPWAEEPGRLQSTGSQESDTTDWLHFHFYFHTLEKEMATHSSVLAWRIPGTAEPGGLPSMGSHRVMAFSARRKVKYNSSGS